MSGMRTYEKLAVLSVGAGGIDMDCFSTYEKMLDSVCYKWLASQKATDNIEVFDKWANEIRKVIQEEKDRN